LDLLVFNCFQKGDFTLLLTLMHPVPMQSAHNVQPDPPRWTIGGPADQWIGNISPEATQMIQRYRRLSEDLREDRLALIESLVTMDNTQPYSLVRQADLYLELNFIGGALRTATRAFNILSARNAQDPNLFEWIKHLDSEWRAQQERFSA
jgi:hypothetical protein